MPLNSDGRIGSLALRPAGLADIPEITAIYAHAVTGGTSSFEWEAPSETVMAERMAGLTDRGFPYFVAEGQGVLLGYAYAGPYRPRAAYAWTVEDSVYVAPNAKRRGVGRALLSALISECEKRGDRLMVAVIGDAGSQASISLHRSLGFREAGTFEGIGWKHGRWLSSVLMQRALGAGLTTPPPSRDGL